MSAHAVFKGKQGTSLHIGVIELPTGFKVDVLSFRAVRLDGQYVQVYISKEDAHEVIEAIGESLRRLNEVV